MTTMLQRLAVATMLAIPAITLPASAQQAGDLKIEKAWSRATPGNSKIGAGYFTVTNTGSAPDTLVSARTGASDHVEIHEMAMKDGVMTMRPIAKGVAIAPGKSVSFAPGGFHLMLMGLKAPLKQGDKVPLTLTFAKAGKVDVTLDVQGIGAQAPDGSKAGHDTNNTHTMKKM